MKTTHGHSRRNGKTRIYRVWANMISRCTNPRVPSFKDYGARGIKVCDRWRARFENFLADMGEPPTPVHELDRRDNDGNYERDNCRWVTKAENTRNRSVCYRITFNGKTQTVAEWAREIGIGKGTLGYRIRSGWTVREALQLAPKIGNRWRRWDRTGESM